MFLEWSIMACVGAGTFMLLHMLISRKRVVTPEGAPRAAAAWVRVGQGLTRLTGGTVLVTLAVLAGTGWSGAWQARPLTGYALMAHVAAGVVFALALAVWVTLSAGRYACGQAPRGPGAAAWPQALCFWMMAALSLPLILSIALNLFPLFAQSAQQALARCHRYSALGFVLAAWGFAYWGWRTEWRKAVSPHAPTVKENSCHS